MGKAEIIRVIPNSLADELGLVAGDKIISINDSKLNDIIDLSFALADEEIDMLIEHEDGEKEIISFDKDYDEELGAEFSSAVFDGIRRCANNCYFCFVNMVAPHMRQSLNIKDDDYRLSFLYGNFITMTNMVQRDFDRIKKLHLSPLYVSIQCMNPELRANILRCKKAAEINEQLDKLEDAGADYHTQVVLCAGLNDGKELERTIREIIDRMPHALSLAIVPVGITKYRNDSFPLKQFDKESASAVIDMVYPWQEKMRKETGKTFIYLGDEFYFLAEREVPAVDFYDGFPQLDNGIGLTRSFMEEWRLSIDNAVPQKYENDMRLDVITGTAISPMIKKLADEAMGKFKNLNVNIIPVENDFFGHTVTVSGLLTGRDILKNLQNRNNKSHGILIPESALRTGEDIFLDDFKMSDLQAEFSDVRIETVGNGKDFFMALSDWQNYHKERSNSSYTWQSNAAYNKN